MADGLARLLLVIRRAMKQIRSGDELIVSDFDDSEFTTAFKASQLVIQESADADWNGQLTRTDAVKKVDFCLGTFRKIAPEGREKVFDKAKTINGTTFIDKKEDLEKPTEAYSTISKSIRAKQILGLEDYIKVTNFSNDTIDSHAAKWKHGSLGLIPQAHGEASSSRLDLDTKDKDILVNVGDPESILAAA